MSGSGSALSDYPLKDIAEKAGVSIATVSRVLNGRPEVAGRTRARVLAALPLGVQTEAVSPQVPHGRSWARKLRGGRVGTIAVSVPWLSGGYFSEIMTGVFDGLGRRGVHPFIYLTMHQQHIEGELFDRLRNGEADGAIVILPATTAESLGDLYETDRPFVVLDERVALDASSRIPVVGSANAAGAKMAAEHLLTLGHRRIGVLAGPAGAASERRLAGFMQVMREKGIEVEQELVLRSNYDFDGGFFPTRALLKLPTRPTAIFAFNDAMALGAMRAAHEQGLTVPDDLSIVGFDDAEIARFVTPALTTVRQDLTAMGRSAVDLLYRILDQQDDNPQRLEIPTQLIFRDSTAPLLDRGGATPRIQHGSGGGAKTRR